MNKVFLIGNLGGDVELAHAESGTAIANFSIATNEKWKDKGGQTCERVEWHRVAAFGRVAEVCGQYISKGSKVCVEGKLQTQEWTDRDGATRKTTKVIASKVEFLGGPQQHGSDNVGF